MLTKLVNIILAKYQECIKFATQKNQTMRKLKQTLGLILILTSFTHAQISEGGMPKSFELNPKSLNTVQITELEKPNIEQLSNEDAINDQMGMLYRVGQVIQTNLSPQNAGTWTTLSDGSKIWQLVIHSKDAIALGVYFAEEVELPVGSKLFAYNQNRRHILGSYSANTPRFQALQMVEGEYLTLEYHAPAHVILQPKININEVTYFYRGVEDFIEDFSDDVTPKAQNCQVDVACSPENNGWAEQIRSVVHFTFNQGGGTFVCSAATINNTANDCKPFILTAWHCGERSANSNINSWVWYWNYQKSSCQPNANSVNPSKGNQTMTGGTVRASSGNGTLNNPPGNNQVAGSDFYLVELNAAIPTSYNPYFAGWDRNNTAATSGVGIHHPNGSAKKISTYTTSLTNSNFNGGGNGHYWRVTWASTQNGHGVTEGGSSGSPIFNQNKRIVGQLTGGSSTCSSPNSPDVYGKMRSNWDLNGSATTAQLKPWLDPINSNVTVLNGHVCSGGGGGGSYCEATASHNCASGDEFISNVTLNTINNTSSCTPYSNFTSQSTSLARGQQYTISIATGIVGSQSAAYLDNQIAAWIDFNQNNTFEVSERLGLTTVAQGTNFPIQYTFTVPSNAALGNTRLRVRLNYMPDDGGIEPCNPPSGPYEWGETEDYTINIVNSGGGGVGIEEEELGGIQVYPNPSEGIFFIDASQLEVEHFELKLFNVQGALIQSQSIQHANVFQLDLSTLSKGVYHLHFSSGDISTVKKIIIQ